jgi:acetolactate synthase-1/2/3 large subunit
VATATEGVPGPVHIGVPAGIANETISGTGNPFNYLQLEKKRWAPLVEAQLEKVKLLWNKSKKPVLAVGMAAVREDIQNLLLSFSEKHNIPVALTPMAKGLFPEHHPHYAGVLFHALSNIVSETYKEADLVIGLGYDPVEFNYEEWMPAVPLIHIDTEKEADVDSGKIPEVFNIIGSLDEALSILLNLDSEQKHWNKRVLHERKERLLQKLTPNPEIFGPLTVVKELRKILPDEGILTVDVGAHLHLIGQMWQTPAPQKLLMTNGWSAMGFAIPAAMAAKLCKPDLPVVALLGDGGFYMTVGELAAVKRLNLKIVFVVLYDQSLSLIHIKQNKKGFNAEYGTDLGPVENEATNHYFGIRVLPAKNEVQFKHALKEAFAATDATVIEAHIDKSEYQKLVLLGS